MSTTLMQQRNNLLVAVVVTMALFLADIRIDWIGHGIFGPSEGYHVDLGLRGALGLPAWLLLSFSAAATGVVGLNLCRVTAVPRWIILVTLLVCGAYYTLPFFERNPTQPPYVCAGPYLALVASAAALGVALVRPRTIQPTSTERAPNYPSQITGPVPSE